MPNHTSPENSVCNASIYASIRRATLALTAGVGNLRFTRAKKYITKWAA